MFLSTICVACVKWRVVEVYRWQASFAVANDLTIEIIR